MSFRFIEDHHDAYPVRLMCPCSTAGYYAWCERQASARATTNAALLAAIRRSIKPATHAMAVRGFMPLCGYRDGTPALAGSNA